jgi:hypothetical protein
MARRVRRNVDQARYGIAEWYGRLFRTLEAHERQAYLNPDPIPECPFLAAVPELAPGGNTRCSKKGGVCSIRNFTQDDDQDVRFGKITSTCPNRFLEDKKLIRYVGHLMLGTEEPLVIKEIPFLRRITSGPVEGENVPVSDEAAGEQPDTEDVGKIDLVFVHPEKEPKEWSAVEIQAVYFSGASMSKDYEAIRIYAGNGIPMPGGVRRPDFRSSGPKRLMPQLQIKVPSLRRWGKKMVVVIDRPFFDAMAPMNTVSHVSNCDVVWVVVDYDEQLEHGSAKLTISAVLFTTLEDSVVSLTAGVPTTLPEFEEKLSQKIKSRSEK